MTEEDILEMGAKPKRTRTKALTREELEAMFAKHDEEILKKVSDKCESCSHHECNCPQRIDEAQERMDRIDRNTVDLYNTLNAGIEDNESRMDRLDENDELLRQGINESHRDLEAKLAEEHRLREISDEQIRKLTEQCDRALASAEEHRLREVSDEQIRELAEQCDGTLRALASAEEENRKFSKQNLWLGVLAGACLGVCAVVLAIFMAG